MQFESIVAPRFRHGAGGSFSSSSYGVQEDIEESERSESEPSESGSERGRRF